VTLIQECDDMGLDVKAPDVNASRYEFTVGGDRTIRYGLGAVRGVGQGAVEALITEREAKGTFTSLEDLCRRLDLQKANRRVLEALLRSGSLDGLGANRATLMSRLPAAMQLGDQNSKAHEAGQNDLFGLFDAGPPPVSNGAGGPAQRVNGGGGPASVLPATKVPELPEWSEAVRLSGERETLGLYLTGHPISRFERVLPRFVSHRIGDLVSDKPVVGMEAPRFGGGKPVTIAGLIDEVKKRGPRVFLTLDDRTGRIEVALFEDVFQKYRDLVAKDALVLVDGMLRFDEFSDAWRLSAKRITELDKIREQQARRLVLKWPARTDSSALLGRLAEVLRPWRPGPCPITVEYTGTSASGALTLGNDWSVRASRELLEQLEALMGRGSVDVVCGAPPAAH
jgi:DNA polymerase-3 subunit alpha